MHWFYRAPIYLGYAIAIAGFIAHFTGLNFLAVVKLDPGMTSAALGTLLSMSYLYLYRMNHPARSKVTIGTESEVVTASTEGNLTV